MAASRAEPWVFGLEPLSQTCALAGALRRIVSHILALEAEDPALSRLVSELESAEPALRGAAAPDGRPRIGSDPRPEQRAYLDHGRDIGAYNPCFPESRIEVEGADRAHGSVAFPIAYEGPPGLVHGGFLALFFDCVIQHHNCEVGLTGKTTSLNVSYRAPTPLLTNLRFEVERSVAGRRIHSEARLLLGTDLLCVGALEAVAGDRSRLPAVSPRRGLG